MMEHPSLRNINPLSPPLPVVPNGVQQHLMSDAMQQRQQSPEHYQRTPQSTPSPELSPRLPVQPQQQQPLRDALSSAFDSSPAVQQSQLDPELVRQVTEQVIKNLQAANLASTLPASPTKATNFGSPAPSDASLYTSSKDGQASLSSEVSTTGRVRVNTGASPQTVRDSVVDDGDSFPVEARGRPANDRRQPSCPPEAKTSPERARQAARSVGADEATTLEKIWTPLFDTAGNPTRRLSQFLRGLALHIIDDYEPRGSLVVTPAKMLRFFTEASVQAELYPWVHIFGGAMSNASLSVMYRKLLCQHHLVQTQSHELPNVPALTPIGFEWFLTCLIQAHPDTEFCRLAKAVMNMPISNADNKSERFPKEISRRLLPLQANIQAEQRIISSLGHEPEIAAKLRNAHNMPPPPPQPPQQGSFSERERMPYAQASSSVDAEAGFSRPIERERKPYTAKEGAGKIHGSDVSDRRESLASTQNGGSTRPARSHQPPPVSYMNGAVEPNGPPSSSTSRHRSSISGNSARPQLRNGRRSSPMRNPYTRSAPIDISDIPPSQYASNMYPNEIDDDSRLRRWSSQRNTNPDYDMSASFDEAEFTRGRSYPVPPKPPASVKSFETGQSYDRRNSAWNEGFDGPQSYRSNPAQVSQRPEGPY